MKIKILKQTFVKGKLAEEGDIIDAEQQDGEYLVGINKAIPTEESAKKPVNKEQKKKRFTR